MRRHRYGKKGPSLVSAARAFAVTGRLVGHRDGYGFVIPDQPLVGARGDIFIGAGAMADAMHGDRVAVGAVRVRSDGRAEGRIVRVLERAQTSVVGRFHFGPRANSVIPFDERIPHQILIPRGQEIPVRDGERIAARREELEGAVVNVELTRFPSPTQNAMGRVVEVLGRAEEFGVDVEIIIRKYHLPHEFSAEARAEAARVKQRVGAEEIRGRRDFRELPIVTIDGETAKDFDDAVAVLPLENGHLQLQVHIADVSHYVVPGTALDREARLRGTSVYFPDRAVPMLPPELSNGICSLQPGEDRLTLSVLLEMDAEGEVYDVEFCEGVIRSAARMTYTDVNRVLEGEEEARRRYAPLVEHFERMRDLAVALNRKRMERGAIDFDLPEPVIELDPQGVMLSITRAERNMAHRLIEEFMLAANEAVAQHLESSGTASLYRIHEKPDPRKVLEFEEIAATFGYSLGIEGLGAMKFRVGRGRSPRRARRIAETIEWPAGGAEISPRHYQRLAETIAGRPEERILSYLMLRSLKQACYRERNVGHFALATECYTHFTSPIRRYPDLIVHRILRSVMALGWEPSARKEPEESEGAAKRKRRKARAAGKRRQAEGFEVISRAELEAIGVEASEAERRAAEAERELVEWKKARFMRDRLGETFEAIITSVTKTGFFVELLEWFVEGFVPVETLTDQQYRYREDRREWVGERTRRRFRIGDRIEVRLDRVGEFGGRMQFSVPGR